MAITGRRGARRLLVQALYQYQVGGHSRGEIERQFRALPEFGQVDGAYFNTLLAETLGHASELDAMIAEAADRPPAQLDPVEHGILWAGLAELRSQLDVPTRVVINEAIELARAFGAQDSHRYVNAILDHAAGRLR
jgi:N utilization substance protein B